MEDVHFQKALGIEWPYVTKLRNRHKSCIYNVSCVYAENVLLVRSLIELVPAIVSIAMRHGRAELKITQEMTHGRALFVEEEKGDQQTMNAFLAQLDAVTMREEELINSASTENKRIEAERVINNTRFFLSRYKGARLEAGITALLRATIKDTWTAIEVMAGDLLETVMQTFPQCFKKVSWDQGEPRFTSRRGIKNAYEKAFPVDYEAIRLAVYSNGIDAVGLLRNVLVHKSGRADQDFITGAKDNPLLAPFHNHDENDLVKIDGEIIKAVVEPAIRAGCDLIMAVDTWITQAVPNSK